MTEMVVTGQRSCLPPTSALRALFTLRSFLKGEINWCTLDACRDKALEYTKLTRFILVECCFVGKNVLHLVLVGG